VRRPVNNCIIGLFVFLQTFILSDNVVGTEKQSINPLMVMVEHFFLSCSAYNNVINISTSISWY